MRLPTWPPRAAPGHAGGKPAGGPAPRFKRQGLHGLGLLLFVATLAHAAACGCQRIEMLAINDAGGGDFGWQKVYMHSEMLAR